MSETTVESHPFQVGRVVYRTLEEAISKAKLAKEDYPEWTARVIDRRTMTQVWGEK